VAAGSGQQAVMTRPLWACAITATDARQRSHL
jgi:hypothetical protein